MQIVQNFFDGINRAVSREEFFNPREFHSLTNCRILESGNIGEIVRINGFQEIDALADLNVLYDIALVNNSAVGTENLYLVFYKNTSDNYSIKIFDIDGNLEETFTYSSDQDPIYGGELKQHENTIFISPHNKLVYGKEGDFFIRDFISKIPRITSVALGGLGAKAQHKLTVNQQLPAFSGRPSRGAITSGGLGLDPQKTYNFTIQIGDLISKKIQHTGGSFNALLTKIVSVVSDTSALNDVWEFSIQSQASLGTDSGRKEDIFNPNNWVVTNFIEIRSKINNESLNNLPIRINNSSDIPDEVNAGQIFWEESGKPSKHEIHLAVSPPRGGLNAESFSGSARINIKNTATTSEITISASETTAQIATKFKNILENSERVSREYDITIDGGDSSSVLLTAKQFGREFNTPLTIVFNPDSGVDVPIPDNFTTFITTNVGTDASSTGTIEPNTRYWYKGRLRFVDGHITKTCSAVLVDSKTTNGIDVFFQIPTKDLDNKEPRLQVFRKRESGEFFLIDEVNLENESLDGNRVYNFVDIGFNEIEPFVEVENIWTKSHNTQEVMDNRYLKGNLLFNNDIINVSSGDFTLQSNIPASEFDRDVAPVNSRLQVYTQPKYVDGSQGYFSLVGTSNITNDKRKIQITQNTVLSNPDKDISELNFYGRYLPFSEKRNFKFETFEMITPNLGAIEDPLLFSINPKIFFGFKFIKTKIVAGNLQNGIVTNISGWSSEDNDTGDNDFYERSIGDIIRPSVSDYLMNIVNNNETLLVTILGRRYRYVPYAIYERSNARDIVWKLDIYDALQEAVSTGALEVTLTDIRQDGLSSVKSDTELLDLNVKVLGIDDKTNNLDTIKVSEGINSFLQLPEDNRLYLILDSEDFRDIDNSRINNYDLFDANSIDTRGYVRDRGSLGFELINFEEKSTPVIDSTERATRVGGGGNYEVFTDVKPSVYYLINRKLIENKNTIYLGSKPNELSTVTFDTTGFTYKPRLSLFYSTLAPYNIYENIVKESDFNFVRQKFANQIIWSSPLLDANYFSGGRNFAYTNFYNVPTENGEIIDIFSLGGNLYVFCEKGVARLLVGETLTQQKSGQVFVDSTNFITKHLWMMENMSPIQKDSICKYEGSLYFTDGTDVYRVGGEGVENISLGVLNLSQGSTYSGSIVSKYDEYRLVDLTEGETFVYNTKFKKWYGPHTYTPQKTVEIGGAIISYDDGLIKEDVGNTFAGSPYMTVIQSVGNDTESGAIDKTYRKFYISMDGDKNVGGFVTGTTLKYGKDTTDLEPVVMTDSSKVRIKNNKYNVGIKNSKGNTKKIFWDIETINENFRLKGFRTAYMFRRRR